MRYFSSIDEETLALVLDGINFVILLGVGVFSDRDGDDISTGATCSSEIFLGVDEDVRDILVFTEQGQVEDDLKRSSISSNYDDFSQTSIQSLCCFVSTFLHLCF